MRLAVFSDYYEERWPSMDLVSEMLVEHARREPGIEVTDVRPRLPPRLGSLVAANGRVGRPLALAAGRYALYPFELMALRRRFDCYHVVDHSYAHLALGLPRARTGVFCHDIDAFRPLLTKSASRWRKAQAALLLRGMRRASVVFYTTESVRLELEEHRLVEPRRLVAAPYGIASEYQPDARPEDAALRARPPYLLHVGSLIPRKNPLFLLKVFGAARRTLPTLELVQVGGEWDHAARNLLETEGLAPYIHQVRGIEREELAAYYRSAAAVLQPSTSEGFGIPVIEALACGALVLVSDIPVLRQVGGEGVVACPVNDLDGWKHSVLEACEGRGPSRETRLAAAARYTWETHAATIVGAYAGLAGRA